MKTVKIIGWICAAACLLCVLTFGYGARDSDTTTVVALAGVNAVIKGDRLLGITAVLLTMHLTNLLASSVLIFGHTEEGNIRLLPWFFTTVVSVVAIFYFPVDFLFQQELGFMMLVATSSGLFLHIYVWLVVYKLFRQLPAMREEQMLCVPTNRACEGHNQQSTNCSMEFVEICMEAW